MNLDLKKIVLNIGIIITNIIMILSILYFFKGSLEMYPTREQMETARIGAFIIIIICCIVNMVLIDFRTKLRKLFRNS